MKICYITHEAPCGKGEAWVVQEILKIREFFKVIVIPIRPRGIPRYADAEELLKDSIIMPLIDFKILVGFLKFFANSPYIIGNILWDIIKESRSVKVLLRNLCMVPKAVYMSKVLKDMDINHIHVHWATIQTTFGLIISKLLGIPFSFSAVRYDIGENNMLKKKVLDASFVRAESKEAKDEILELTGLYDLEKKIHVIYMGVPISPLNEVKEILKEHPIIACPANLVEKKGHKYLIEACSLLRDKHIRFKCLLIGDGPEYSKIDSLIRSKGLEDCFFIEGYYPHNKLMRLMEARQIDLVVLPSIITKDGLREGIPVILIEAMSFCIPVISTNTGGISELLGDKSGIMVKEKDSEALAEAIYNVLTDKKLREGLVRKGYNLVNKKFNRGKNCKKLANLIEINSSFNNVK
ncbi:glycosyltransferase [Desulfobacterota bacterium AH_259_B03_O07]|nr:glycosyltransferase [Desulfobacterota bacterium AH_259_B03_O07]